MLQTYVWFSETSCGSFKAANLGQADETISLIRFILRHQENREELLEFVRVEDGKRFGRHFWKPDDSRETQRMLDLGIPVTSRSHTECDWWHIPVAA